MSSQMMTRAHNFSAGPAALPLEVLLKVKEDLPDYQNQGVSIMEMSHRGPVFLEVFAQAQARLRALMGITEEYEVLFLQGGAQAQFALLPMNLMQPNTLMGYVETGHWSRLAIKEAQKLGSVKIVASGAEQKFTSIPAVEAWDLSSNLSYLHITPNETIHGVEFHQLPSLPDIPLLGDMSSTILSRPIDVSQYGVIYAGAQKNIGPAGVTLVIIRKDLLERSPVQLPSMLNYKAHASRDSMYNTPPTFAIYLSGLVFEWIEAQGGLQSMATLNQAKAARLYQCIDRSSFFNNPVITQDRSWMNVPFTLADPTVEARFLSEAAERNLVGLKGHKSIGGMRASLYNAVSQASVDALVDFMTDFEKNL